MVALLVASAIWGAWRAAVTPQTKLLFADTPTNPLTDVCDIAALAQIAKDAGAVLAVDNCFASPILQRPIELGASQALVGDTFSPRIRSAGMTLSPFNAWAVLKGRPWVFACEPSRPMRSRCVSKVTWAAVCCHSN
jgi:O-acetylhomoserine/O-acetylserine sulfhydrylase-like pyridoxal-dependent enzyme